MFKIKTIYKIDKLIKLMDQKIIISKFRDLDMKIDGTYDNVKHNALML